MLLSDRDIRAEVAAGRIGLEPYAAELIQPSSIDVRLDRYSGSSRITDIRTSTRRWSRPS